MTDDEQELRERHFVEEFGVLFEEWGMQRMWARVLGRLLVCTPNHQSSAQLSEYLLASRGAISGATRSLLAGGFIEKRSLPGDRATYFRLKDHVWAKSLEADLFKVRMMRELATRGLQLKAEASDDERQRLHDMHDVMAFYEAEMPLLLERWNNTRGNE